VTYQHDVRGQVASVHSLRQASEHYSYDANLNIAAHGHQGPVDAHRYLPGGLPERIGYARYRYDVRGRTIEKTVEQPGFRPKTWQFTWDGLNRLTKVCTPERGVWVYRYDAFHRRVEKQQIGGRDKTEFLWAGYALAEQWKEQRDGTTGQVVTWHMSQTDLTPVAQETDKGIYPVLADQVGLPNAIFDSAGTRVWSTACTLWGRIKFAKAANDSTQIDTTSRFPGQWEDDETGLCYNLNRHYDPDTGQYLSTDPVGLNGGLRTHGYVHDPLQLCDFLGLQPCERPQGKTIKATVYRYEQPDRLETTWSAHKWNVASNHRYTKPGLGGVYGADSPGTALGEVNHYGVDLSTRVLINKDVTLNNALDLTDPQVREQMGVSLPDITGNSYDVTHVLGDWANENGYDGILAPSARNPGGANLISFGGF
jgi:RHS repeat-associated protein